MTTPDNSSGLFDPNALSNSVAQTNKATQNVASDITSSANSFGDLSELVPKAVSANQTATTALGALSANVTNYSQQIDQTYENQQRYGLVPPIIGKLIGAVTGDHTYDTSYQKQERARLTSDLTLQSQGVERVVQEAEQARQQALLALQGKNTALNAAATASQVANQSADTQSRLFTAGIQQAHDLIQGMDPAKLQALAQNPASSGNPYLTSGMIAEELHRQTIQRLTAQNIQAQTSLAAAQTKSVDVTTLEHTKALFAQTASTQQLLSAKQKAEASQDGMTTIVDPGTKVAIPVSGAMVDQILAQRQAAINSYARENKDIYQARIEVGTQLPTTADKVDRFTSNPTVMANTSNDDRTELQTQIATIKALSADATNNPASALMAKDQLDKVNAKIKELTDKTISNMPKEAVPAFRQNLDGDQMSMENASSYLGASYKDTGVSPLNPTTIFNPGNIFYNADKMAREATNAVIQSTYTPAGLGGAGAKGLGAVNIGSMLEKQIPPSNLAFDAAMQKDSGQVIQDPITGKAKKLTVGDIVTNNLQSAVQADYLNKVLYTLAFGDGTAKVPPNPTFNKMFQTMASDTGTYSYGKLRDEFLGPTHTQVDFQAIVKHLAQIDQTTGSQNVEVLRSMMTNGGLVQRYQQEFMQRHNTTNEQALLTRFSHGNIGYALNNLPMILDSYNGQIKQAQHINAMQNAPIPPSIQPPTAPNVPATYPDAVAPFLSKLRRMTPGFGGNTQ